MDGMQKVLEEIRDLLLPKENYSLVLSSTTTEWSTNISPPLYLNPKRNYELALVNLETYYSIPNIDSTSNTFKYSPDGGTSWKTITLPIGSYEIDQINAEVKRQLKENGDWDSSAQEYYINIAANTATLRATVEITSVTYRVDMAASSVHTTLGFNPQTLGPGYHKGENSVNILSVNSILVHCDIISGSFLDGGRQPVIYSFFPNVSPGEKIVESPNNLVYLPVATGGNIQRINVRLTDQASNLLNLRGENVSLRLHIRSA